MSATNSTIQTSNSSYASVGQNWDGYEAQCYQQRFFINHSCFNDSSSSTSIFGASDTISVPTVSTPSVSGVNGNNCCWLGEWVGVGTSFHTSDGTLIQAGIAKATNYWNSQTNVDGFSHNNIAWYEASVSYNDIGTNDNLAWPTTCSPIQDGDSITISVKEDTVTRTQSTFHFTWNDLTHPCNLNSPELTSNSQVNLSVAYFIVEAPHKSTCNYVIKGIEICQIPAYEPAVQQTAWFMDSSGNLVSVFKSDTTQLEDILNQCQDTSGFFNIHNSITGSNSWQSPYATSAQQGINNNNCGQTFTFVPSPNPISLPAGTTTTQAGIANSVDGFWCGSTCEYFATSVVPPSGLTVSCNGVTIPQNWFAPINCTFNISVSGSYAITLTSSCPVGTSGIVSCSASLYANPDFTISADPVQLTTVSNSPGASTITLSSQGGFGGTIAGSLTTPSGISCTLNPTTVTLTSPVLSNSGQTATASLSCTGSAGTYTVTVTGTSGSLSHPATITYNVQDFAVAGSPTSVPVLSGTSGTSTIAVSTVNGFTGTISLAATVSPSTELTCTLSPTSVPLGTSGTSTLSCSGSFGTYTVTVTGTSGSLSHSATVTYTVNYFTVTASPTSITVNAGVAGTSTITVAPVNGFAGTVTLAVSTNSTNLSCTLSSTSITGGSGTSTLSCTGSVAGNYLTTVTGTSGTFSYSPTVTYLVQDFTVTASPASVSVPAGTTAYSTVSVSSLNSFSGTVILAATVSQQGLSCTLSSTSITGSGSSALSCVGTPGSYSVTVTGTSGPITHSIVLTFVVANSDFTISVPYTSYYMSTKTQVTETITLNSVGSFTGTVQLVAPLTSCPQNYCSQGPGGGALPSSVSLTFGSGTSTLRISSGTGTGNYIITLAGNCSSGCTSQGQGHSIKIYVTVSNNLSPNTVIFGFSPSLAPNGVSTANRKVTCGP